jgi:hypothetical protein
VVLGTNILANLPLATAGEFEVVENVEINSAVLLGARPLATISLAADWDQSELPAPTAALGVGVLSALEASATGRQLLSSGAVQATLPTLQATATGELLLVSGDAIAGFPPLQASATGGHLIVSGDAVATLPALTGLAQAYLGSKFRPSRIIPSWQLVGGAVSFDIADVPLIGGADDSRQVLMALLQLWYNHYLTVPESSTSEVSLQYVPKNVMPPSKGDNFVWCATSIDINAGGVKVLDE